MDEVKGMFAELIGEIKHIKKSQCEHTEIMERVLKENEELRSELKYMEEKIEKLDTKVEFLERERKRNNLIFVGYEPRASNNYELKHELKDFKRNDKIRTELKVMSAVQKIEQQQLRWFGHIVKMEEDRTVKIIWETEVNKKIRRGRPRKRWKAQIAESLRKRGLSWSQAKLEAKDRKKWRRTLTSTPAVEEVADNVM